MDMVLVGHPKSVFPLVIKVTTKLIEAKRIKYESRNTATRIWKQNGLDDKVASTIGYGD
jgi:hypothetical protein